MYCQTIDSLLRTMFWEINDKSLTVSRVLKHLFLNNIQYFIHDWYVGKDGKK